MENNDDYDMIFKLILIGDSGVGKTNILGRYIKDEFSNSSKPTVGVEFYSKPITFNNNKIKLQIWDTAGQERYRSVTRAYYKGSKGAFVVYDITNKNSFENVDKWIGDLKENGDDNVCIVLIGNKNDLENDRKIEKEDVKKKAEMYKVLFCETSALNNQNIEQAFNVMVEEMCNRNIKNKEKGNKNSVIKNGVSLDNQVMKGDNKTEDGKTKNCC